MNNDAPLNELDYLIFTVDGQAIYSIGNNIFNSSNVEDIPTFLSGLVTGVQSFSQLLRSELRIVTAVGQKSIFRIIVSPEYMIEPRDDRDIDKILLERRLGKLLNEEMNWKREPQRGLCLGFEVISRPFWVEFPDVTEGFQLHYMREMAENFFTAFSDQIRKFDFNFDPELMEKTIGNESRAIRTTIDLGHPVFVKKFEATVIFTDNQFSMNIEGDDYDNPLINEVVSATAATLYTGMNYPFKFSDNETKEGWMVVDFGGTETVGSSLFIYGKEQETSGERAVILTIAVAEKSKYVLGGKGDVSTIMRDLRDKARKETTLLKKKQLI